MNSQMANLAKKLEKIKQKNLIKQAKAESKAAIKRTQADANKYVEESRVKARDARYAREDKLRKAKEKAAERRYKFTQQVALGSQAIDTVRAAVTQPSNALVHGSSIPDPENSSPDVDTDIPKVKSPW